MTDIEQRIKEICKVAHIDDISDLLDGYHTFKQLYYQRMMLFAVIVKQNRDKAWKSLRHEDGKLCFGGGWFIVGIDTPEGSYTYHYEDNYFSLFDCVELERGKPWDGHTEKDVTRLLSLEQKLCSDMISRQAVLDKMKERDEEVSCLTPRDVRELPSINPQPKTDTLDKIRSEIQQLTSRYTISRERGSIGQVEWVDRLIREDDILQIIDKYKAESEG